MGICFSSKTEENSVHTPQPSFAIKKDDSKSKSNNEGKSKLQSQSF